MARFLLRVTARARSIQRKDYILAIRDIFYDVVALKCASSTLAKVAKYLLLYLDSYRCGILLLRASG